MKPHRTGPLTAIAVVNLLIGVGLISMAAFGVYISEQIGAHAAEIAVIEGGTEAAGAQRAHAVRDAASVLRLSSMFALVAGPVMIASGIGLFRLAPWGRVLGLLVAWIGLAFAPLSAAELWLRAGEVNIGFFPLLYWLLALTVLHSAQTRTIFAAQAKAQHREEDPPGLPARLAPT